MGGLTGQAAAPDAVPEEVMVARAYLSRVAEPSCVPLWAFVDQVGPVAAAQAIRRGGAPEEVDRATAARRDSDPYEDLEAAARLGARLLTPESAQWPHAAFAALRQRATERWRTWHVPTERHRDEVGEEVPPLALWARGDTDLSAVVWRSAGIVGARAATEYGDHVAKQFAYELARRGVTVVSGGAYGIDAAAHRGALSAGGVTALVSAAGLGRPYPPGNAALYDRVAASGGIVLSESPPGCAPHRHRFLMRNRLIAALSVGVVVVEAARRSGALNTANHARRQGRPVMAVPGSINSPMSSGCHEWIRDNGATLVASADHVLQIVGSIGEGLAPAAPARVEDLRVVLDGFDPTVRQMFDGLPARDWASASEIAARAGLAVLDVVRGLPTLELAGLIEASDRGYRISPAVRRPASPRAAPPPARQAAPRVQAPPPPAR